MIWVVPLHSRSTTGPASPLSASRAPARLDTGGRFVPLSGQDPPGLRLDLCENGVKHVTWELASARAGREFFAVHTVGELAG